MEKATKVLKDYYGSVASSSALLQGGAGIAQESEGGGDPVGKPLKSLNLSFSSSSFSIRNSISVDVTLYSPPLEEMKQASQAPYKGQQAENGGIMGFLEVLSNTACLTLLV